MNKVSIVGRLTKDVELRQTESGKFVGSVTVAVQQNYKNAKGEYGADFPQVVIWGKQAEIVAEHVKKGHMVGFTGRIATRTYEKDGVKNYITEVIAEDFTFLQPKPTQA